MARNRSLERDKAFEIYKENHGNITNRAIAKRLSIPEKTVSAWKCRDKWSTKVIGVLQKKSNEEVTRESNLNDKQRLFCLYYIQSFNATSSYKKAYRCAYNTAKSNGYKLLTNTYIKVEISTLIAESLEETEIQSKHLCNAILQKYIDIAFADIGDFVRFGQREVSQKNGEKIKKNYLDLRDSSEVDGTIIAEIRVNKDGAFIKLHDKMKALDFLARHLMIDAVTKEKLNIAKEKLKLNKQKLNLVTHINRQNNELAKDKLSYQKSKNNKDSYKTSDDLLIEMLESFKNQEE